MRRHLTSQVVLVLGLVTALTLQQTRAQSSVSSVDRTAEPVIVNGSQLMAANGAPVSQIFVYAYTNNSWAQIRFQVDEKDTGGKYVAAEDQLFDTNDELVFMAKDAGERAPDGELIPGEASAPLKLGVVNPLNPAARGWVYVVRSATLTQTFSGDYVSFDAGSHQITGETYKVGFALSQQPPKTKRYLDFVTLNGGPDILDRSPKFRSACFGNLCGINEDTFTPLDDGVIKDGPVRLIMRGGQVLAYGSTISWAIIIEDTGEVNNLRTTTDFSEQAIGSTMFSAVTPAGGVTVDGTADTLPETPASPWWQLSTDSGTIIQVADIASLGGTVKNIYRDTAANDPFDTGDKRHYGDIGFSVDQPNQSITFVFSLYMLAGRQQNVGNTYAEYFKQPLAAMTNSIYVPSVQR